MSSSNQVFHLPAFGSICGSGSGQFRKLPQRPRAIDGMASCDQADRCANAQSNRLSKRAKRSFVVKERVVMAICFMTLSPQWLMVVYTFVTVLRAYGRVLPAQWR